MRFQMVMGLIVLLFHGGVFARAVHACPVAIGPRMVGFGEAGLEATCLAAARKEVLQGIYSALAVGARRTVIGEHGVDRVRDSGHQVAEELGGDHVVGVFVSLGIGTCARAVNGDTPGERACCRADLRDVAMDGAQGLGLELLLRRCRTCHLRQAGDAVVVSLSDPFSSKGPSS